MVLSVPTRCSCMHPQAWTISGGKRPWACQWGAAIVQQWRGLALSAGPDPRLSIGVPGHWRAINHGVEGSLTVTCDVPVAQVTPVRGPDRSDSQADSAGPIPVTSFNLKAQVRY